jgi:hypothetical protein
MMTFSINNGLVTSAKTYPLIGATSTDLSVPLSILYNNTIKEITPGDLRDSILTLWSNSIFTQTSKSGIDYIGIDTSNPDDRDLKNKIFLGKRAFSSTASYIPSHDIMTNSLLSSNVDIFLYNTKKDNVVNSRTRISILSGTNSIIWPNSPFIQSDILTSTSSQTLDIINPGIGGNIEISSRFGGTISVNNIIIPSIDESTASASNNKLLKWQDGKTVWDLISIPTLTTVGVPGERLNMYGNPVNVNGYPLQFTDDRYTPLDIGGIPSNSQFDNEMAVELLRRMIYTYLPPTCDLEVLSPYSSGYVEIGTAPQIKLKYTITKRTLPTNIAGLTNMIPSSYPAISQDGRVTVTGTASGIIISPVPDRVFNFSVSVSDSQRTNTASASVTGILPYFWGFSTLSSINFPGDLATLTKSVTKFGDKSVELTGGGNLYFIYDSRYPNLDKVYDNLLQELTVPTPTIKLLGSPNAYWQQKEFKIYKWASLPTVGPPSVIYQFKY